MQKHTPNKPNPVIDKLHKILSETPIEKAAIIELFPILKEIDEFKFYNPSSYYGILDHSINSAELTEDLFIKRTLIFHDIGKIKTGTIIAHSDAGKIITKFPGHEMESVKMTAELLEGKIDPHELYRMLLVIKYHDTPLIKDGDDSMFYGLVKKHGTRFMWDLLLHKRCDQLTHHWERYANKIGPEIDEAYIKLRDYEKARLFQTLSHDTSDNTADTFSKILPSFLTNSKISSTPYPCNPIRGKFIINASSDFLKKNLRNSITIPSI